MKFPRNARILRSPFDMAPFAAVFFLLVIFVMLAGLIPTPGMRLQPPRAGNLPGVAGPHVAVGLDASGRYYFENEIDSATRLKARLMTAVKLSHKPLTLIIHADKSVTYDQLVTLTLLASSAGIHDAWLATLPGPATAPAQP